VLKIGVRNKRPVVRLIGRLGGKGERKEIRHGLTLKEKWQRPFQCPEGDIGRRECWVLKSGWALRNTNGGRRVGTMRALGPVEKIGELMGLVIPGRRGG